MQQCILTLPCARWWWWWCPDHPLACLRALCQVVVLNRRPDLPPPDRCPPDLADLLTRCWAKEPGQRPDMPQVVSQLQGMVMTTCSFVPLATHVEQQQQQELKEGGEGYY